jgi:hypothetical protein
VLFDFARKQGRLCALSEHCIFSSTSRITPNRHFMRTYMRIYCIYICYLILHGSRVGYVRYRNTAYLAVPLVSFLTNILYIHIGVHTVYIYMLFDGLDHCYVA